MGCPLGQCNCSFLIMCMVSIPASNFIALQNDLNPSIGSAIRFTARWSCSTMFGTTRAYLGSVAHFAHWCRRRSLDLGDLQGILRNFVQDHLPRCDCARRVQTDPRQVRAALSHLMTVLACHGVVAVAGPVGLNESVLQRFDEHLEQARGLAASTRHTRLKIARSLILRTSSATPSVSELRQFIATELARVSPASDACLAVALRSYLRFRAFEGDLVDHLLPVIASTARWRLAPLPKTLSVSELDRLLNAFPPNLPSRLRAFAITRCLVDLGLRSSEAINLNLDDINWKAGTLARCASPTTSPAVRMCCPCLNRLAGP